jgi:ADP-ribose pyrophosphatase YjhB (NUDIX family)
METGEKPEQAAVRELYEETRIVLDADKLELFAIGSLPEMNQVYLVYRGEMTSREMSVTEEASEVGLFCEQEAPWSEQAYPDLEDVARLFYRDHQCRDYGIYCCVYENGIHKFRDTVRCAT